MNCFDIPNLRVRKRYADWILSTDDPGLKPDHEEAVSNLVPILLCGEQSAVLAFTGYYDRFKYADLMNIAIDEYSHERALQYLYSLLPLWQGPDIKSFFVELGEVSPAHHFARIAHLDTAACKILAAVERSNINRSSRTLELISMIKHDEARHVIASRKYAVKLGITEDEYYSQKEIINKKLWSLLFGVKPSFEAIGVDIERVFK